ncbi:hypothetical protein CNEO4_370040 [Clostridium neonatale]|nr:hypothetical protein CNEO2_200042 [Clostridium neonatale]CAI3202259.1 hypothetical protein CNEO2_240041 [Clostridium neonatale]CAI3653648.1 hypothetical protein CNEO4_370040 [Clostridium neonatale]
MLILIIFFHLVYIFQSNLNTSHVNLNHEKLYGLSVIDEYLNTSHVNLNPIKLLRQKGVLEFKYISC